ncbi:MAG TPA: acyltransferase [Candidatus Omnitrophota bacterium]|nr:acyltransferase [Candidatus Omnitrophota bacterium]HRZ15554.1 acyltransferase [Candidatus Omnitrophota bacterium]
MIPTDKTGYTAHASACIDPETTIGAGTRIWHFSHVLSGSVIGKNCVIGQNVMIGPQVAIGDGCKIQNNVSVYKGVTLEEGVFCGPSCVFTNVYTPRAFVERKNEFLPTLVKKGATIGANATIVCGVTLGRFCMVGAGAVVKKDVPDHAIVAGVPAVFKGYACECGKTLDFKDGKRAVCDGCSKTYLKNKTGIQLEESR